MLCCFLALDKRKLLSCRIVNRPDHRCKALAADAPVSKAKVPPLCWLTPAEYHHTNGRPTLVRKKFTMEMPQAKPLSDFFFFPEKDLPEKPPTIRVHKSASKVTAEGSLSVLLTCQHYPGPSAERSSYGSWLRRVLISVVEGLETAPLSHTFKTALSPNSSGRLTSPTSFLLSNSFITVKVTQEQER